ncbi:MAG: polysaccharide pyruvyl transferase family protein [Verrucomicrobiales bacterium]|nr:polysaccharide pyruvyl transferase family protein [Verrucomicrobiales bacterium]
MQIYYAADNRNRANWGCRATSMALGSLLASVGTLTGTCQGTELAADTRRLTPHGGWVPRRLTRTLASMNDIPIRRRLVAALSKLGTRFDFVDTDPSASADRFLALKDFYPWLDRIFRELQSADCLVINGEGDFIFTSPPRRGSLFLLTLMEVALQMGKQVYLLNGIMSDCPKTGRNATTLAQVKRLFPRCAAIAVRDPDSLEYLHSIQCASNASYVPDALFTWSTNAPLWTRIVNQGHRVFEPFGHEEFTDLPELDLGKPYLCLSGSSSAAWDPPAATAAYTELARSLKALNLPILLVPTCEGDAFLHTVAQRLQLPALHVRIPIRIGAAILAKAAAFVSGRYHPSILASLGGTPCVFLGSNSHKTASLQRVLEYESCLEFPALPNATECRRITEATDRILTAGPALRNRILTVAAQRSHESRTLCQILKPTPHA